MKKHSFSNLTLKEIKDFIDTHENVAFGFLNKRGTKVNAGEVIPKGTEVKINGNEMSIVHYTIRPNHTTVTIVDFATPCMMTFKKTDVFIGCVGSNDENDFRKFKS